MSKESWADKNIGKSTKMKVGAVIITILLITTVSLIVINLSSTTTTKENNPVITATPEPEENGVSYNLEELIFSNGVGGASYYFGGIIRPYQNNYADTLVINTLRPGVWTTVLYIPLTLNSTFAVGGQEFTIEDWGTTWVTLRSK